jgi:TrmH family RNA methyltransferase
VSQSPLNSVVVVLVEPQNVVNIAGCVRAMMNFGLRRLRLVGPVEFSPYRIAGIAHRSEDVVEAAETFSTLDEAIADVTYVVGTTARARTVQRNYVRPSAAASEVVRAARKGAVALLFGREDRGLSNTALDRCNTVAIVPTDPAASSLNLAQACLLICYEIFNEAATAEPLPRGKRDQGPATQADLEEMFQALQDGLGRMEFYKGAREPESVIRTLRTLLSRAEPTLHEARLVRAIGFEIRNYLDRMSAGREGPE